MAPVNNTRMENALAFIRKNFPMVEVAYFDHRSFEVLVILPDDEVVQHSKEYRHIAFEHYNNGEDANSYLITIINESDTPREEIHSLGMEKVYI